MMMIMQGSSYTTAQQPGTHKTSDWASGYEETSNQADLSKPVIGQMDFYYILYKQK